MSENIITFDKVNKWYGNSFHVLRDIDLQVKTGERIVVCGPSGSGKSTLIRCINRLEEHQQGHLTVDGVELTDDVKAIDLMHTAEEAGEAVVWTGPKEVAELKLEQLRTFHEKRGDGDLGPIRCRIEPAS